MIGCRGRTVRGSRGQSLGSLESVIPGPSHVKGMGMIFLWGAFVVCGAAIAGGGTGLLEVRTAADLQRVGSGLLTNGIEWSLHGDYVLMNDIDVSSSAEWNYNEREDRYEGFEPIGTLETPFVGSFDGRRHLISGLHIHRPERNGTGLFAAVGAGGVIKNTGLAGVSVRGGFHIGALAGRNTGKIVGCHADGTLTADAGFNIGGLIGSLEQGGQLRESYAAVTVTAPGSDNVGGLVGLNWLGGIFDCYSTGDVTGARRVGGLVGARIVSGDMRRNYATGAPSGAENVGGFVGRFEPGAGSVRACNFWDTTASGTTVGSGFGAAPSGRPTVDMQKIATFDGTAWGIGEFDTFSPEWDIVGAEGFNANEPSVWYIDEANDYPRLGWQFKYDNK